MLSNDDAMLEYSIFIAIAVLESAPLRGIDGGGVTVGVNTGGVVVVVCLVSSFFLQETTAKHINKIASVFFIKNLNFILN